MTLRRSLLTLITLSLFLNWDGEYFHDQFDLPQLITKIKNGSAQLTNKESNFRNGHIWLPNLSELIILKR